MASHLKGISLGPLEIRDLSLVVLALPIVLGWLTSGLMMCLAVHVLLRVSESACVRVAHHGPWLLGIDFGVRHLGSVRDDELDAWGQPLGSPRQRRALSVLDWIYTRSIGLLIVLYAPAAVVRTALGLGTGDLMWWISAAFVPLALLRGVLLVKHVAGVWRSDDEVHPLAHLVPDNEIERYREQHAKAEPGNDDG